MANSPLPFLCTVVSRIATFTELHHTAYSRGGARRYPGLLRVTASLPRPLEMLIGSVARHPSLPCSMRIAARRSSTLAPPLFGGSPAHYVANRSTSRGGLLGGMVHVSSSMACWYTRSSTEEDQPRSGAVTRVPDRPRVRHFHSCAVPRSHEPKDDKPASEKSLPRVYLELSKYRLSSLVAVTAMAGYAMCPMEMIDFGLFASASIGTALAIASASTFNQVMEINLDAKMKRTHTRILPSGRVSKEHAIGFGTACGIGGALLLWTQTNPVATALAVGNIGLYTLVYTPMKLKTPWNTWAGAVVGAIPPLIGWAACSGGTLSAGALSMGYILYTWQLPHFLSLSYWNRDQYEEAGYKMLSNTNLERVAPTSWNYSLACLPFGAVASAAGVVLTALAGATTWWFALDSLVPGGFLALKAYEFKKNPNDRTARGLFKQTLFYLPVVLLLMLLHKRKKQEEREREVDH